MTNTNYNLQHKWSGAFISGTDNPITVGDIRDAIAAYPDDAEIVWSACGCGRPLKFSRFKSRGEKALGIELGSVE